MKKPTIGITLCALLAGFAPAFAGESDTVSKVQFHYEGCDDKPGMCWASWVIRPDARNSDVTVGLVGFCHNARLVEVDKDKQGVPIMKPAWNLELLGGAIFTSKGETPLFDVRLELSKVNMWFNAEWIDPLGQDKLYLYGNWTRSAPWGAIGIETENVFGRPGADDMGVGPMAVVKVSKSTKFVLSHQWGHFARSDDSGGHFDERSWIRFIKTWS